MENYHIAGIIGIGLILYALFFFATIPIETASGKHVGVVTAVEDKGLFFKTTTIYFKTSTYTSQEDTYCLDNRLKNFDELKQQLNELVANRKTVEIEFIDYLHTSLTRCNSEGAIMVNLNNNVSQVVN